MRATPPRKEKTLALQLKKNERCFVCGNDNPYSLKVKVVYNGEKSVTARFLADERYGGWSNYLHGGILSLIFDELMGWLSVYVGCDAVTARLEVRYRDPVPLGSWIIFTGTLEKETRRLLDIKTTARLEDGSVVAEGAGRMMVMKRNT
jgi:acyl-coenzyme A thioesterase PaaI-like protein